MGTHADDQKRAVLETQACLCPCFRGLSEPSELVGGDVPLSGDLPAILCQTVPPFLCTLINKGTTHSQTPVFFLKGPAMG